MANMASLRKKRRRKARRDKLFAEFVQLIKLQQNLATGGKLGNNRVRPPRLELAGAELAEATAIIEKALATAPAL